MTNKFQIKDAFWNEYQSLVLNEMIPYQYNVLTDNVTEDDIPKSHSIENFKIAAGLSDGDFYGQVFQDSDTYKWLEAVAYALMLKPNPILEKQADEIIDIIKAAQEENGYLNTYFSVVRPDGKWANLKDGHELYCAGHLIEAAVAYFEATGKDKLLNVAIRFADHIDSIFGENKRPGMPGHPEIEPALVRLYRTTKDKRYLELAKYFIDFRGTDKDFFKKECETRGWQIWNLWANDNFYRQNKLPVREEVNAIGHAVRAVYLYTGMALTAAEASDNSLLDACERMWNSIVNKRLYITGGIGSSAQDREAFTRDYDLPNDTAYTETCASVGLIFFAKAMAEQTHNSKYIDVMELALYNTVLASIQRDGKAFFYTNPLEVDPEITRKTIRHGHVHWKRPKWHGCACCPPNAARLLASINKYAWHEAEDTLYADLFIGGEYTYKDNIKVICETDYPYDGKVTYKISGDVNNFKLAIRKPAFSRSVIIDFVGNRISKDGYIIFENLKNGDEIYLELDMSMKCIYPNPRIPACRGKYTFMSGPLCYCVEDADNGDIDLYTLAPEAFEMNSIKLRETEIEKIGRVNLAAIPAYKTTAGEDLYSTDKPVKETGELLAIPYYLWGNRTRGKMRVWIS